MEYEEGASKVRSLEVLEALEVLWSLLQGA